MFKYMGHMHICNAPSVNNNYWVNVYNCIYFRWSRQANKENQEVSMKELREKLHQAIDKYGISDERTISISQELDKLIYKEQRTYQRNGTSK